MPLVYGLSGFTSVPQGAITGQGPPGASFMGQLGQQYFDTTTTPPTEYIYNGQTWTTGGASPATTTTYGTVLLTDNHEPVATKFYADNLAIAGAPNASTTVNGISFLATNADVVSPYNTPLGANTVVTPANISTIFASPPAIGGTAAAAGSFTTLAASSTLAVTGAATLSSTLGVTG